MKFETVIIGGGITGLSVAYHLKNEKYVLLEKENIVGGLCKSVTDKNGFTYDYTGHLLHIKSGYVKKLAEKLLKKNLALKNRNSWIYSNNVFTRYPFQANLFGLPEKIIYECIDGLVESKLTTRYSPLATRYFYDWCLKTFGNGISKYFMIPYNEKLWKINLKNLTTDWLGNYVPQPTLQEVIKGAFTDDNKKIGYNATFFYPKTGGIQALIDSLKKNIPGIKTDVKISLIDISKKIVKTNNGDIQYKNLVSTIPLPEIVKLIKSAPENIKKASKKLKWTSVLNINLGIKRKNVSDKHWIYFPEKKFDFYRTGFYRNFSESLCPDGTSSMYIEISYPPEDHRADSNRKISKEKMLKKTIGELKSAGVLKSSDKIISECILDIPYAYVIYDKNRKSSLETIQDYLKKKSILSIGRYGGWQYSTMEDAILEGKEITKWLK